MPFNSTDSASALVRNITEVKTEIGLLELQLFKPSASLLAASILGAGDPRDMARVKLEAKKQELDMLTKLLDETASRVDESTGKMRWKGEVYALAELAEKYVDASKREHAFAQVAAHFVKMDGTNISVPSLRNSLKQRQDKLAGQ